MVSCPSDETLVLYRTLKEQRVSPSELEKHISQCRKCRLEVESLDDAKDSMIMILRKAARQPDAFDDLLNIEPDTNLYRPKFEGREKEERHDPDATELITSASNSTDVKRIEMPKTIARYEVIEEISEGSFGRVFRALDPKMDREVALKVTKPEAFGSKSGFEQFVQEARRVAKVSHTNIVTVHDVERIETGESLIAMEFVSGRTFEQVLHDEAVPQIEKLRVIRDVAKAVHFAHSRELVHRDLKPANILIDEDGSTKVADFGLAMDEENRHQHKGEIAGTWKYMSPEQVRGLYVDGRADVWAIGVMLYEALAGKPPFRGDKETIIDEIKHRDPKPLRQVDDSISPILEEACKRCLSKSVKERHQTAKDVADDLQTWIAKTESTTGPLRARVMIYCLVGTLVILSVILVWQFVVYPRLPVDVASIARNELSLLGRNPQIVQHDKSDPIFFYSTTKEQVCLRSRFRSLVRGGKSSRDNFSLEVQMSKVAWTQGASGLFLGRNGPSQLFVYVRSDPVTGEFLAVVERNDMTTNTFLVQESKIPRPTGPNCTINVATYNGTLRAIKVNGLIVPSLTAYLKSDAIDPNGVGYQSNGEFGLMNREGTTVYNKLSYTRLD